MKSEECSAGVIVVDAVVNVGLILGVVGLFDVVNPIANGEGVFINDKRLESQIFIGVGALFVLVGKTTKKLIKLGK
jgi:hypothetical protein